VKLGREAAQQVEEQMPILRDATVTAMIDSVGDRLVDAIPEEFRHPEFDYTFDVVNVRDINAFALPGGPSYFNRGMIEAANSEGEVAGVIAHELSHIALRHGTAQATKATKYELGSLLGAIVGSVIGGNVGSVVSAGTQFGLGTAFMRYSREYERQADILGSHIMAAAGYDPLDMAQMFRTIQEETGSGGPEWLSDHPNPGNRYEYIRKEAESLNVQNPVRDTSRFDRAQARLGQMEEAPTMEQATRNASRQGSTSRNRRLDPDSVAAPSTRFRAYNTDDFRVSVPSNWNEVSSGGSVALFAPQGGYGNFEGRGVFTHGVEVGIARTDAFDLRSATEDFVESLSDSNPDLQGTSRYERTLIEDRDALHAVMSNRSDATRGEERISLYTTLLDDETLFYVVGVAPRNDFVDYEETFDRIVESVQFRGW
jgi:hypothetical protein